MKKFLERTAGVLSVLFGIGMLVSVICGGLTFVGYLAALAIGGDTAAAICEFIYKTLYPRLVYFSSVVVMIGLLKMYLSGQTAMAPPPRRAAKRGGNAGASR